MKRLLRKIEKIDISIGSKRIETSDISISSIESCECFFIQASRYFDPTDYLVSMYDALVNKYKRVNCVYVDLSKIYGTDASTWLQKIDFLYDKDNELYDVKFYSLIGEEEVLTKNERIIVRDYISEIVG